MPAAIDFCSKHNVKKHHYETHQKYDCRICKREAVQQWRENNRERSREIVRKSAAKRKAMLAQDKILNPHKYIRTNLPAEFCSIHNVKRELSGDVEYVCRQCKLEYARNYRATDNRYKATYLRRKLKKYNLTLDQYEKMIESCSNKCMICHQTETRMDKGTVSALAIDHCHKSYDQGIMKVRGLLCHACNSSLGSLKENISTLQSAILYLKKHEKTND